MANEHPGTMLLYMRRLLQAQPQQAESDGQLLQRFALDRDETAFAALLRRHGRLVWGVCRHVLCHEHDAEDAFQATFLVLARRAAAVHKLESVGSFLHGIAYRISVRARQSAAKRQSRESRAAAPESVGSESDLAWRELQALLDDEVARLPEKYRGPFVLCGLEGHSRTEAAAALGLPTGTVSCRIAQARRLLQERLARRGVSLTAVLTAGVLWADAASAAVPTPLARTTLNVAVGQAVGALSPTVTALISGTLSPLRVVKRVLSLALVLTTAALGVIAYQASTTGPGPEEPKKLAESQQAPAPRERLDTHGDPLPPGAILRLGSSRLHHPVRCTSVVFSPVSDLLASAGDERVVRIWDSLTGKELRQLIVTEKGVNEVAFSPDGKLLAGGGRDGIVYLWDAASGQEVRQLQGQKGEVLSLAFSSQGNLLAVGDTQDVHIWEVVTGKLRHRLEGNTGRVESVAFAPDGKTVAGSGMGIRATDRGTVVHEAPARTPYATALLFSRDGQFLITLGASLLVWETATGKTVERLSGLKLPATRTSLREHCVARSPDGQSLAIAGQDGLIRLWDWARAKEVRQIARLPLPVHCLAFSRDGKTLASGGNWGGVRLWDVATGQEKVVVEGHQEGLTAVACASDSTIATTALDGTVRLWDGRTGKEKVRCEIAPMERDRSETLYNGISAGAAAQSLNHLALAPDGKQVAAARRDGIVMVWDTNTGREVRRHSASRLAFSHDNKLIATLEYGANGNKHNPDIVCLYDRASGQKLHEIRGRSTTLWFDSPLFLPDSRTVMAIEFMQSKDPMNSGSRNHDAQFVTWDVGTAKQRKAFPSVFAHNHQMQLSPDGRTLATRQLISTEKSMNGNTIILWELASGGRRADLVGHTRWVNGIAFSPDGRTLASGAILDGTARLWDVFSGLEICRLEGHRGWVNSVAFGADGKTLVSGSTDATALVWDITHFLQRGKPIELSAADLDSCWQDLAADASVSFRAISRLLASPQQMVALFTRRLQPVPKADRQRIERLIGELDSETFGIRDAATKELEKLGNPVSRSLEKALSGKITLEMKRRLEGLLERLNDDVLAPDQLREVRAVEALEKAGTEEALRLLQHWVSEGAAGARLTREADAALRRIKAR